MTHEEPIARVEVLEERLANLVALIVLLEAIDEGTAARAASEIREVFDEDLKE